MKAFGDGTTTSILLSSTLIKNGLKLIEEGYNPIELKKKLEQAGDKLIEKIKAQLEAGKTKEFTLIGKSFEVVEV